MALLEFDMSDLEDKRDLQPYGPVHSTEVTAYRHIEYYLNAITHGLLGRCEEVLGHINNGTHSPDHIHALQQSLTLLTLVFEYIDHNNDGGGRPNTDDAAEAQRKAMRLIQVLRILHAEDQQD